MNNLQSKASVGIGILTVINLTLISCQSTNVPLAESIDDLNKESCIQLKSEYQKGQKEAIERVGERDGEYRSECNKYDVQIPED